MTRDFTPIKKCCLGCHQKVLDTYEIKHGKEKDEKVNTTNYADLPIFRVPTIKKHKAKVDDISSLKEVDLSEESTYQDLWLIK